MFKMNNSSKTNNLQNQKMKMTHKTLRSRNINILSMYNNLHFDLKRQSNSNTKSRVERKINIKIYS